MKNDKKEIAKVLLIGFAFFIATTIILSLVIIELPISDTHAGIICSIGQACAGLIAAVLIVYQLSLQIREDKEQKEIEGIRFLIRYNEQFLRDTGFKRVLAVLNEEFHREEHGGQRLGNVTDAIEEDVIAYLIYLEGLAQIFLHEHMSFDVADDLLSVMFFMATNNPEIQEKRLKPNAGNYRGIFKLYKKWYKYKKDKGLPVFQENYSLAEWKDFDKFAE